MKLKSRPGAAATSAPVQVGGGTSFGGHRGISALQYGRHRETWSSWVALMYCMYGMAMSDGGESGADNFATMAIRSVALYLTASRNGRGRKKDKGLRTLAKQAREQDDPGSWGLEEPLEVVDEQQRVSDKWVAWAFLFKGWLLQASSREEVSQPYPMGRRPKGSSSLECSTVVQRASHGQGIRSPISACESSLGSNGRPVLGPKTGDRPGGDGWDWVSWCNARPSSWEQFASWTRGISQRDQHRDGHAGLENGPNPPHREASRPPGLVLLQYDLILSGPAPKCTVKMNESRETGAPVSLPSRHELPDNLFCNGSVQRPQMSVMGTVRLCLPRRLPLPLGRMPFSRRPLDAFAVSQGPAGLCTAAPNLHRACAQVILFPGCGCLWFKTGDSFCQDQKRLDWRHLLLVPGRHQL